MLKYSLVVVAALILGGCTQVCDAVGPDGTCAPHMRAKFLKDGFNLKVTHTRYQWVTSIDDMTKVCRSSIHTLANRIAAEKGREIEPIDDAKLSMDYDRNHTAGTSTCVAKYPVAYKQ